MLSLHSCPAGVLENVRVVTLKKPRQSIKPGKNLTGADAAIAPATKFGYLILIYAASIPP